MTSAASAAASATTTLAHPTAVAFVANPTSVLLSWTNNDADSLGYYILRATDGVHFTKIATVNGLKTTSYTDSMVTSGHQYQYEIEAFSGSVVSAASTAVAVTTPLVAPINLAGTTQDGTVKLTWTDKDTSATGYLVQRSLNNSTWTTIATLSGVSANSYVDTTVAPGTTYYYRVEAVGAVANSAAMRFGEDCDAGRWRNDHNRIHG